VKTVTKAILGILFIISCSKNNESKSVIPDENKTEFSKKEIFPDFINLTDFDFAKFEKGNNSKWFKSKKQKLYFLPYTDYSITTLVLTTESLENNNLIELLKADKIIVEDSANSIKTSEFVTDKGIKLNVSKKFAESIFGKPDSIKVENDKEIMFWNFVMIENRKNYEDGKLKPFVHNGLDFNAELTFRNDSLKTLIYKYDIP